MPETQSELARLELVVDGEVFRHHPVGGVARYFSELIPRMCGMESRLHATVLKPWSAKRPFAAAPGITFRPVPPLGSAARRLGIGGNIASQSESALKRILAGRSRGKIWHSTYYTIPRFWKGFKVVTVHDLIYELWSSMYPGPPGDDVRDSIRKAVSTADAIICVSENTRRDVIDRYEVVEQRTFVTHHGLSEVFARFEADENSTRGNRPYIMIVGARGLYKEFSTLVRAYGRWAGREGVDLLVVGGAWTAEELRLQTKMGVRHKVKLRSGVKDVRLAELYAGAEAFVFPSLYEGFGIPLLEAMAVGCPLVASRIPTTEEVAADVPIYFEPGDGDGLVKALDVALDEGKCTARTEAGRKLARSFTWDRAARQTLEVYRGL